MNDLIERLLDKMPSDDVYPNKVVVPIKPKLRGRSFFPGGCGLFHGSTQPLCERPIMLVGQDFGTLEYWNTVGDGDESEQGTWTALRRMLLSAAVHPTDCFFTNALLGVRAFGPIDGPSPGLAHPAYLDACLKFIIDQIREVRPSVVVTFGKIPTVLLTRALHLAKPLPRAWADKPESVSWPEIDSAVSPFIAEVKLPEVPTFAVATSVHPDRYWLNTPKRAWSEKQVQGQAAHDLIWQHIAGRQKR